MDTEDKKEIYEIIRNYEEMDETGKEKLKKVSEKIFDIWNTVNKGVCLEYIIGGSK